MKKSYMYKILYFLWVFLGVFILVSDNITKLNYIIVWVLLLLEYAFKAFFDKEDTVTKADNKDTTDGEIVCHCNLKENAELIAKIMDNDCIGEVYNINDR